MRLFFDVDGVLLNFERTFVSWLNANRGLALPDDYETSSWYFEDVLSVEACREAWHVFMGSEEASRMPPLLEPEHFNTVTGNRSVHLLTNFPDRHMDKREANLSALGFHYDSLHYCGFHANDVTAPPTKAQVVGRLLQAGERGLFLDDHPDNCLDVARNCPGVEVWLMSRRFNRGFAHPQVRRAEDWASVIARLESFNGNGGPGGAHSALTPSP